MTLHDPGWHAARAAAHASGRRLPLEQVPLAQALHRRAGEPLHALTALPPHDASAMDGWAVAGNGPWTIVGQVLAGQRWADPLVDGQAIAIATGAVTPEGATSVVRREDGTVDADVLTATTQVGDHIRRAGEECAAGDVLVTAGTALTPLHLGLLAAAGHDTVTVVRRPRARVLVLGDELLAAGPARDGRVRDSLGIQVPAWLQAWGCTVDAVVPVPDTSDALRDALGACDDVDVIVTTGGTAAGPVDLLHTVFADLGGRIVVDGVDCRPGHPMLLGAWDDRALVGLPGNPHAAVAALMTLALPLLDGLHGAPLAELDTVALGAPVASRGATTRLVPAHVRDSIATPCEHIGSGMLRGLAAANGLAVVVGSAAAGDHVEWLPMPWLS